MDQFTSSFAVLLETFSGCFRTEAFATFRLACVAWIVCPGTHTLSEVWQATGLAGRVHHDRLYSLFESAKWEWDELGKLLLLLLVARLVPTGRVWIVVDDTLAHKRGATVAFGGFFLDPVLSSRKYKNFRFGLDWVVLGLAVHLPFRPDRTFVLPVLWRVYRKEGVTGHRKRTELAAELATLAAGWLPERAVWLVADLAYINAAVLRNRPANLKVLGPLRPKAALYDLPEPRAPKQRGRPRLKGQRLPTPQQMVDDGKTYPATEVNVAYPGGTRCLRVQMVRNVLWWTGSRDERVSVLLVRDPAGQWRDGVLLATDLTIAAEAMLLGYAQRWGIEVAFRESKQHLGLAEPQVRTVASVERAHPMAFFLVSLTVLWYALGGKDEPPVERERPWYRQKQEHTFTDMLGTLRLYLWNERLFHGSADTLAATPAPEIIKMLLHYLSAVH